MKLILNIDDLNYQYLNKMAQQDNTTVESIVNDLIQTHIMASRLNYSTNIKKEGSRISYPLIMSWIYIVYHTLFNFAP
ncbi:hypothetical protein I0620_001189 [Staphylococcus pseudintermedius]|nr:hypothetical protein [Staphylococcus pseudintermedius]